MTQQWEYRIVSYSASSEKNTRRSTDDLNELAREGWEVVAMAPVTSNALGGVVIMKRPFPPGPPPV